MCGRHGQKKKHRCQVPDGTRPFMPPLADPIKSLGTVEETPCVCKVCDDVLRYREFDPCFSCVIHRHGSPYQRKRPHPKRVGKNVASSRILPAVKMSFATESIQAGLSQTAGIVQSNCLRFLINLLATLAQCRQLKSSNLFQT